MAVEAVREMNSAIYGFGRGVAWVLNRVFLPVKYHGMEKLRSREGAMVLISNHRHALDPLVLAWPVRAQCVFLGKKELGKNGLIRDFLARVHCILVDRHNTDMEAMRACMKAIRLGKPLIIFPEGTRHHEGQMQQIENGTAMIVLRGKAPLIPVYFDRPLKLFRRAHVWVGDPIEYADLLEQGVNRDTCEALNERMRETYRRMVAEHGDFG